MDILRIYTALNYLLGIAVVIPALFVYFTKARKIPLYIALAIITAGPLEDLWIANIKKSSLLSPVEKEQYTKIVDNITSMAFLVFLGLAVKESAKDF